MRGRSTGVGSSAVDHLRVCQQRERGPHSIRAHRRRPCAHCHMLVSRAAVHADKLTIASAAQHPVPGIACLAGARENRAASNLRAGGARVAWAGVAQVLSCDHQSRRISWRMRLLMPSNTWVDAAYACADSCCTCVCNWVRSPLIYQLCESTASVCVAPPSHGVVVFIYTYKQHALLFTCGSGGRQGAHMVARHRQ